jgi:PKD repeat protein
VRLLFTPGTTTALVLSVCLASCSGDGSEPPAAPTEDTAKPATPSEKAAPAADELVEPLLAWAEAEPEDGKAPLTVQFNADIEGGTAPLTITWTFGDESAPSSESNPSHTYAKAGSYRADLEVKDSAGDADSDWVEIEVE